MPFLCVFELLWDCASSSELGFWGPQWSAGTLGIPEWGSFEDEKTGRTILGFYFLLPKLILIVVVVTCIHTHTQTYTHMSKLTEFGAPGRLCRLSIQLQFRSWSWGSWVQAPHRALCCQCRACFRSSVPSLSTPPLLPLCLSKVNKHLLKKKNSLQNSLKGCTELYLNTTD